MTVIAYKDGILAADRGVVGNDAWKGSAAKLSRSPAGTIAATAGEYSVCAIFHDLVETGVVDKWLHQGGRPVFEFPLPLDKVSFGAIVVDHRGEVFLIDRFGILCPGIDAPAYADGSGKEFAMGAMMAGADALRAVQIACELDCACRGPVDVMRLNCS